MGLVGMRLWNVFEGLRGFMYGGREEEEDGLPC